jgi:hypothetical protein
MNKYLKVEIVEAEPIILVAGKVHPIDEVLPEGIGHKCFKITHSDGSVDAGCPLTETFEKNYLEINPNPKLKTGISISIDMVNNFIKETHVSTIGDKTTLVRAVLVNGFEIIESSACVDKENYNEAMGTEICLEKIKDKVWFLLGFLLQTAVGGIK